MKRQSGFTIIELLSVLVIVILIGALGFIEKNNLDASSRDKDRKVAINALYYGLTEGFYKQNKYYPAALSEKELPYVDKTSFTDQDGKKIGDPRSEYHYSPKNCTDGKCRDFELKAALEKEATYKKATQ